MIPLALLLCLLEIPAAMAQTTSPADRPAVLLAFDDSGDFGPSTPDTRTAGWQEALDYCLEHGRDLYVKGGYGGRKAIYHIDTTINVPPAQDFRIDGGVYVINFKGPDPTVDAMRIDSAMNCDYLFGIIVYGGSGAGLRIKPENPVPIDGFPVVVESKIHSQGIADPHPFTPGERDTGTGLVLDAGLADISYSQLYFASVLNFRTCIEIASEGNVYSNEFTCEHLHTNAHSSTLFKVGAAARQNSFRCGIGVDQSATRVTGLEIAAARNTFAIATRPGGFTPARQIVLQSSAEGNQILLCTDEDPLSLVIDRAAIPTNQLDWTGPPAPIRTLQGTTGTCTYTQRLFPAQVTVLGEQIGRILFERADEQIDCTPGRDILLSVGDRLIVESRDAPSLRVVHLKGL